MEGSWINSFLLHSFHSGLTQKVTVSLSLMMNKDYTRIFVILPIANDIVILASYRFL